jgi:acetate kinase
MVSTTQSTLVVNAGSSSLKVKLLPQNLSLLVERIGGQSKVKASFTDFQKPNSVVGANGVRPELGTQMSNVIPYDAIKNHDEALRFCLEALSSQIDLQEIQLVAHRVVHGGERYTEPVILNEEIITDIVNLSNLAPLHNPANLEGIRAARHLLPQATHVAVFDTAFHATLPAKAFLYGLPRNLYQQGIRKYGFHGPSHDYVTRQVAEVLGKPREELKIISLHLGNGASAAAVSGGKSLDTTMGLTPLDGLLMGTRSGEIDPGVLLHLLRNGSSIADLDNLLNKQSGLLGLSGVSNDMRDVRQAAISGNIEAKEALEVFCYRITKTIGSCTAAMSGLDAVVFTGGIGENDSETRAAALQGLEFFGVQLDAEKNQRSETVISTDSSRVKVLVIRTDEEAMMAKLAQKKVEMRNEKREN